MKRRRKAAPAGDTRRDPDSGCGRCQGTGWAKAKEVLPITRQATEGTVTYSPGVVPCPCTRVIHAETEEIDRARKAAGERREE